MNVAIVFALVIFLLLIIPIITIEAVNILFGLEIQVTLITWLCTFWLIMLFGGSGKSYSKK
jgi:hypothetical protein